MSYQLITPFLFLVSHKASSGVKDSVSLTVTDPFESFETEHPDLVAVNSNGEMTGNVVDFCKQCPSTVRILEYLQGIRSPPRTAGNA